MRHCRSRGPGLALAVTLFLYTAGAQQANTIPLLVQSGVQEPPQNQVRIANPKPVPPPTNPRIINSDAWKLLAEGGASEKSSQRANAVSALATIGTESRAVRLIEAALDDTDRQVRVLAATALGEMKSHGSIPWLREALDDSAAEVQFAAARSLWAMGDHTGQYILAEVLAGDRRAGPGVVRGRIMDAKKKLHDPGALTLIGVNETAGAFLGPFSMGLFVIEAFVRDSSAPARVLCATLLAPDNSPDTLDELQEALGDKNWVVRAAAAKALGNYRRKGVIPKLQELLQDDKEPVRFMAAASLVRLTRRAAKRVAESEKMGPSRTQVLG